MVIVRCTHFFLWNQNDQSICFANPFPKLSIKVFLSYFSNRLSLMKGSYEMKTSNDVIIYLEVDVLKR